MNVSVRPLNAVVWLLAGALLASGCGDEPRAVPAPQPPKAPGGAASARPGAVAAAAPGAVTAPSAGTQPTEFTFDSSLRDPFAPTFGLEQQSQPDVDCGPLCQFDVSQFRITGIIWGISAPAAMLRAPDGKPFIVKVGMPIGRNKGKIVSITKDRIAVLEKYVNYRGEVVTNRIDIELPPQGGSLQ